MLPEVPVGGDEVNTEGGQLGTGGHRKHEKTTVYGLGWEREGRRGNPSLPRSLSQDVRRPCDARGSHLKKHLTVNGNLLDGCSKSEEKIRQILHSMYPGFNCHVLEPVW